MPRRKRGSDYHLLQMKYARENLLNQVSSQRERARKHYAEKLPTRLQKFYFDRISQLSDDIGRLKKAYPKFRGQYDPIY